MDNSVTFDYCIGVSAGSANGVSFVAGQRGRNIRFYTEHINEKGYFGLSSFLKTGNLFGLQYIYGTLTNSGGADPLDFDAFMKSPMEYWLVATDAQTGKPAYFSKKDMHKDDYRHVMASLSLIHISTEHSFGKWTPAEDGKHTRTCTICGATETGDCTYENGACTVCGCLLYTSLD